MNLATTTDRSVEEYIFVVDDTIPNPLIITEPDCTFQLPRLAISFGISPLNGAAVPELS